MLNLFHLSKIFMKILKLFYKTKIKNKEQNTVNTEECLIIVREITHITKEQSQIHEQHVL